VAAAVPGCRARYARRNWRPLLAMQAQRPAATAVSRVHPAWNV